MPQTTEEKQTPAAPAAGTEKVLAQAAPAALAKPAKRGLEQEIDRNDIILPRVRLLQPTTPEVIDQSIPGAKTGELMNSITKELLGKEFIPIVFFKNWGRFNPRKKDEAGFDPAHEPGATIWLSYDKNDERVKKEAGWGPDNEKPLATSFLNFLSFFPGQRMPLILSFSKTSYKAGKQLLTLAEMAEGDLFSRKYRIVTETRKYDQGTFAVMKAEPAGPASAEEFAKAEEWYESFGKSVTQMKMDDPNADEGVPSGKEEDIPF